MAEEKRASSKNKTANQTQETQLGVSKKKETGETPDVGAMQEKETNQETETARGNGLENKTNRPDEGTMLQRGYITERLMQNEEFIVIGLTGRVGSGCSEAASIFGSSFEQLNLPSVYPGYMGLANDEERDRRILFRFANQHWVKFDVIQVRTVIVSFLLPHFTKFCNEVSSLLNIQDKEKKGQSSQTASNASNAGTNNDNSSQVGSNASDGGTASENLLFKTIIEKTKTKLAARVCTSNVGVGSHNSPLEKIKDKLGRDKELHYDKISETLNNWPGLIEMLAQNIDSALSQAVNVELGQDINITRDDPMANNPSQNGLEALKEWFREAYKTAEAPERYEKRTETLKWIDELLEQLASEVAKKWWCTFVTLSTKGETEDKQLLQAAILGKIGGYLAEQKKPEETDFSRYVLVHNILPALSDAVHEEIRSRNAKAFTELFQKYGNCIRRNGSLDDVLAKEQERKAETKVKAAERVSAEGNDATRGDDTEGDGETRDSDAVEGGKEKEVTKENREYNTFAMPRRINQFIKTIRHPFDRSFARPTRIVIDSIKNAFEATYLRERYSAFYLFAISADENVRIGRLMDSGNKNLSRREIQCIDWNEYSNQGAAIYSRFASQTDKEPKGILDGSTYSTFTTDEIEFLKGVVGFNGTETLKDTVRQEAYAKKLYQFVLQDVGASIESADVFISNNHNAPTTNMDLRWEIVRNVCLIMYPGLLLPTPIERCMQIAFAAKANSGCLSRQVGAVVTDDKYNILSIGWNDVPCGDISCSRKNLADIHEEIDLQAYSDYEIENSEFRERLKKIVEVNSQSETGRGKKELLCGLPWRYCFKDVHADTKEPMRSRAMHAEEKALARVGDEAVGGYLFTTSSPCEMCSKNAKNHRIKKIYYIEPYPGINEAQYSQSGCKDNRAQHILFTGAIGRAYTQMYTPIMPHKDILAFLGIKTKMHNTETSKE